jgi:hypothetical protein
MDNLDFTIDIRYKDIPYRISCDQTVLQLYIDTLSFVFTKEDKRIIANFLTNNALNYDMSEFKHVVKTARLSDDIVVTIEIHNYE